MKKMWVLFCALTGLLSTWCLTVSAQDATSRSVGCPLMSCRDNPCLLGLLIIIPLIAGLGIALIATIIQRKKIQNVCRQTAQRLEAALQATRGAVFFTSDTTSPDMQLLDFSTGAEEIFGYHRDEVIGQALPMLFSPEDAEKIKALHQKAVETGHPASMEPSLRRKDGSLFPSLVTAYPVKDKAGKLLAVMDFSIDLTDHKQSEQQERQFLNHVQHAEKLKSLEIMAGGIAHDFNNLLVGVLGNADLALTDLSPLSPARASIEAIKDAAIDASELTRQMLAYSGKGRLNIELVDLNDLIKSIDQLLKISVSNSAVLQYHLEDSIVPIETDVTQIRQLLVSLVANGSDALGEDSGVIDVRTSMKTVTSEYLASTYLDDNLPPGQYVCLEIHDTGCGMPAGQTAQIFDPFFTTKSSGKGLGLATVLGIVRRHNGAVRVDSTVGQGTTFTILLPGSEKPLKPKKETPSFTAMETPENLAGTILVIDDQERVRNVLESMLKRRGCTIYTDSNGQAGITTFANYHDDIDLVILNMTMPGLSGSETLKELVKINPKVKVILCTGYPEEEARKKFAGTQLAGFIHKPFKMEEMISLVGQVLNA
ncbi:MAG: response regulator [Kiritimatiellae bacterium]|nr:response regulator [Kiritimatiellia bacterium]